MNGDTGSVPMAEPLAYFLTWTTYGTWLPGDLRGWVDGKGQFRSADFRIEEVARARLVEAACKLDPEQRHLVEATIQRHCEIRQWNMLAVACRTNHVHAVVSAAVGPDIVMDQFKAWCSRRLKEQAAARGHEAKRKRWWTEGGSKRFINDEGSLESAVVYVNECQ